MEENFAGLVSWFKKEKRQFPWRRSGKEEVSPYAVWISEVMLQQTRAEVVIPYFLRWMKHFPDIAALAQAKEEEVIKVWEGLGYYARARRLLQASRYLMAHHGGNLPSCPELLAEIPGFGPYTTGAVASFAFHRRAAAVDGNVLRFLSRFLLIEKDIAKPGVQGEFRQRTLEILPDREPWVAMEAMIELGATVCKKIPNCSECPVSSSCKAFANGVAGELPVKTKPPGMIRLTRKAVVVKWDENVLVGRVPPGQVMAGLYEFPFFEEEIDLFHELSARLGQAPTLLSRFDDIRYSFTRYNVTLQPTLWEIAALAPYPGFDWHPISALPALPFSSGHRRLLEKLIQYF